MRAVRYERFGGPEVLEVVEVDEPEVRPGTVRIRVAAAGINPADRKRREGAFAGGRPLAAPATPGFEAAGTVDAVGDGVTGVEPGDEVFGFGQGTWAEVAVLDVWAPRPEAMPVLEAAATPVPVETALRALDAVRVGEGDTVVISGAAGGVGTAAIQLARARGAIVIGTASEANQEYLEALGALATTYDTGWPDRVRDLAVAEVDAALDLAGAGVIPELVALTGDAGRVVSIADFSAGDHGAQVTGSTGDRAAALAVAAAGYEDGSLRMIVEREYPLDEAVQAQEDGRAGHARGRSVLLVGARP
ncbi:NADP-dependent oxidoreductase [Amnibacterium endophyticum]|uniref:NADP-dependent oxidoreductase n=1 Tax=Amnibacterium endophyticum TaxID=2109337 RepID=A0ABW4LHN3_9MICO